MQYPKFLKEGFKIGIPAPSSSAEDELHIKRYQNAIKNWEELGYQLFLSKNLFHAEKARSASAKERGEEINKMWNEADALICASGGEFLVECLPYIDFKTISKSPKLIAGFSDPTGLLYPLTTKYDIATIYGSNFSFLGAEKQFQNDYDFLDCIKGKKTSFDSYPLYEEERIERVTGLEANHYTGKVEWKTLSNKKEEWRGRIIGGCLDVIAELIGTSYDGFSSFHKKYKKDGIIWYFDNCALSMEEVIRTLWKMNEFHYFDDCKGVIFGRFGIESSFIGYDLKTCLEDCIINELKIPIIYDADISHKAPSLPIINGSIAEVTCKDGKGNITFHLE